MHPGIGPRRRRSRLGQHDPISRYLHHRDDAALGEAACQTGEETDQYADEGHYDGHEGKPALGEGQITPGEEHGNSLSLSS